MKRQQRFARTLAGWPGILLGVALAACGSSDPASGNRSDAGTGGSPDFGTGGAALNADAAATGEYFPFALGNLWEYDVVETGSPTIRKINEIVRMEPIGGTGADAAMLAFRVETRKPAGSGLDDATISWQQREGSKIVRYREISCRAGTVKLSNGSVESCTSSEEATWMPGRQRIDERPMNMVLAKGLAWLDTYLETKTTIDNKVVPVTMHTTMATHTNNWIVVDADTTASAPVGSFVACVILSKTSMNDTAKRYTFCRGVGKVKEEGGQTELLAKYTLK